MDVMLNLPSLKERERTAEVLRHMPARVVMCAAAAGVLTALAVEPLPDVLVTDLRDERGHATIPLVALVRRQFPSVPIVAYCAASRETADDIVGATREGLSAAALRPYDDLPTVLRRVIHVALGQHITTAAFSVAAPYLTPSTRPIVGYCLSHAYSAPNVEDVAAALGVCRKTVAARLVAAGLPPASVLVSWGRLLLASRLLEDLGRPVERVALRLGYDSGAAFRHMLTRYTGLRPGEVRARGGLEAMLPLFVSALRPTEHRALGRDPSVTAAVAAIRVMLTWLAFALTYDTSLTTLIA